MCGCWGQQPRHLQPRRLFLEGAGARTQHADRRLLIEGPMQSDGTVARRRRARRALDHDDVALAAQPVDQGARRGVAHRHVVRADECHEPALHPVDAVDDRDAGRLEPPHILDHGRIVGGHEHHRIRPAGQGFADQHLLLPDIVRRLGHVVHRPSTGLGRHPVGGEASRGIGRIDPVLGEDGECDGTGHVSSSWVDCLLQHKVGNLGLSCSREPSASSALMSARGPGLCGRTLSPVAGGRIFGLGHGDRKFNGSLNLFVELI